MENSIHTLLQNNRSLGAMHSHVMLTPPHGTYMFGRAKTELFWRTWCETVQTSPDKVIGLGEKPQTYIPVLADIDIKRDFDVGDEVPDKLYTHEHILKTVEIYQTVIATIVANHTQAHLTCIVLEKPAYTQVKTDDHRARKNGFHLHFPFVFLSRHEQELHLIPRIREAVIAQQTFADIGLDCSKKGVDKIIDKAVVCNAWLLYGSRKASEQEPYRMTHIYDHCMNEVPRAEFASMCTIYDTDEQPIPVDVDNLDFLLPRILSIIPMNRDTSDVCKDLLFPPQVLSAMVRNSDDGPKKYDALTVAENLEKAAKLMPLLSDARAEDRNEWMSIGWTLFTISEGGGEGLNLWMDFSRRSESQFNESQCIHTWNHMEVGNSTIATLIYFAKQDSPEALQALRNEDAEADVDILINGLGTQTSVARALYKTHGDVFVCAGIVSNSWFHFENHIWVEDESGVSLTKLMSAYLVDLFRSRLQTLDADEDDEDKKSKRRKGIIRMINNLENAAYKKNVLRECAEIFYDREFLDKLNANPYIIGMQNGVYDLKANIHRAGQPSDFISKKMKVAWNTTLSVGCDEVLRVHQLLAQFFPNANIRRYFLDTIAEIFVGGNSRKHVYVLSGDGDNGKSMIELIIEEMMGEYAIKLPTSLIVGSRTQSSSASPELIRAGDGVRFAVLQEPDKNDVVNVGILKEMSGNDTFYARGLFQKGREIVPMFTLYIVCNDMPRIPHNDRAAWNRLRVILFEANFCNDAPEDKDEQVRQKKFPKDEHFKDKIPEIIEAWAWVLLEHRRNNPARHEPAEVTAATNVYKAKNDVYMQFIDQRIVEDPDGRIHIDEFWAAFKIWFKDSFGPNKQNSIPSKTDFIEYVQRSWGGTTRNGKPKFAWTGRRLSSRSHDDDDDDEVEAELVSEDEMVSEDELVSEDEGEEAKRHRSDTAEEVEEAEEAEEAEYQFVPE